MSKKILIKNLYFIICLSFIVVLFNISTLADNEKVIDDSLIDYVDDNNLNLYFFDLGSVNNGDSFIITIGDVQILVDAGTNEKSKNHIIQNIDEFLKNDSDKVWEYMILTHPHKDHISNAPEILDYFMRNDYELSNIIDFEGATSLAEFVQDDIDDDLLDFDSDENCKSAYEKYVINREKMKKNYGTNHITAIDIAEKKGMSLHLNDDTYLTLLYNYFYDHETKECNNISICFMITKCNQKLLFTGDLMNKNGSGEKLLIENNSSITLPNGAMVSLEGVTFYKAAHHGSNTSSSIDFINYIRPSYVAISCSAGTTEYGFSEQNKFPSREVMNNLCKYTDYIYITNQEIVNEAGEKDYIPYHGNILFKFDGKDVSVNSTNNCDENNIPFTIFETDWFIENRYESIYVYNFDEPLNSYSSCTLIKYGHYDILVDCGSTNFSSTYFIEQIGKYCIDGVIECAIISHYHYANFNQLIGSRLNNGILTNEQFIIEKIIDPGNYYSSEFKKNLDNVMFKKYRECMSSIDVNINMSNINGGYHKEEIIEDKFFIEVIAQINDFDDNEDSYSLTTIIHFYDEKFLFVGDKYEFSNLIGKIGNVSYYKASNSYNFNSNYKSFLKSISSGSKRTYTVIGTSLNYLNSNGSVFGNKDFCDVLLNVLIKDGSKSFVYPTSYINSKGEYVKINGTLCFEVAYIDMVYNYSSMRQEYNSKVILLENSNYYSDFFR